MLKERVNPFFPDHLQVLQRRFSVRILRGIPVLLFHDILTGILRTLITILILILSPLTAKNDPAVFCTELRLVVIGAIAAPAGIIL